MNRLILGAIAVLALLAGCAGPTGGSPLSPPSPTPNPGATYLRIVKAINDCDDRFYAEIDAQRAAKAVDYGKIRAAAGACVPVYQKFNTDLLALEDEAPKAKSDIDAMRKSVAASIQLLNSVVGATSDLATAQAVLAVNQYKDGGAAALVRSDLGLPAPSVSSPSPTAKV